MRESENEPIQGNRHSPNPSPEAGSQGAAPNRIHWSISTPDLPPDGSVDAMGVNKREAGEERHVGGAKERQGVVGC